MRHEIGVLPRGTRNLGRNRYDMMRRLLRTREFLRAEASRIRKNSQLDRRTRRDSTQVWINLGALERSAGILEVFTVAEGSSVPATSATAAAPATRARPIGGCTPTR